MDREAGIDERVESLLWPFVADVLGAWDVPGAAIGVVHDGRVIARGFGSRDRSTGEPVTDQTLFHLASISKSFVATAALQLVEAGRLELDGSITAQLPGLRWADPRAERITLRQLLAHTSGVADVSDYGWHEPELDDEALARFSARVTRWQLEHDPGAEFAYSNAAYEVVGHLVATTAGRSFETQLAELVLRPIGMTTSTFLRGEVPPELGALPHVGLPPRVVPGAYPYTRRHAPSSTLHSSAAELGRWMLAQLAHGQGLLARATHDAQWSEHGEVGWGDWHEQTALGWFRGTYRGQLVVGHSGDDPGFQANLALLPEAGLGVAVLTNCNTAPVFGLTAAALDVLLGHEPPAAPLPPATVPLAAVLEEGGVPAALARHRELAAVQPPAHDLDEEGFEEAVWGAIELHRTELAWPVLELWLALRPDSADALAMIGWAHEIDGDREAAIAHLRQALAEDPDHEDARARLARLLEPTHPPPR